MSSEELKYPVGRFQLDKEVTPEKRATWINQLAWAPKHLRQLVQDLDQRQLSRTYRPNGWTVRQVVHHIADSHVNGTVRIRLALTEDTPTIKPYDQDLWAQLWDAGQDPVEPSLQIIEGLHQRLVSLLQNLSEDQFRANIEHPDWGEISVDTNLQIYSWHSLHHLAHIENALRE